jgi:hypothetical protein
MLLAQAGLSFSFPLWALIVFFLILCLFAIASSAAIWWVFREPTVMDESLCCPNCQESIPIPGEPGQCRTCGYVYDGQGKLVGDPEMLFKKMSKANLARFNTTRQAEDDEQLRRGPIFKEKSDD